jgi:hypothetical protein
VPESQLRPSTQIIEAEWIKPRLRAFGSAVAAVVPDNFPAYVRILHPARGIHDKPLAWAHVAAQSGRTMHRLAQFHAIARSASTSEAVLSINPPQNGNLPPALLKVLCDVSIPPAGATNGDTRRTQSKPARPRLLLV